MLHQSLLACCFCFVCLCCNCCLSTLVLCRIFNDVFINAYFSGLVAIVTSVVALVTWDIISMNPADSHSFLSLITQYPLIRGFEKFLGKMVLRYTQRGNSNLEKCQERLL